MAATTTLQPSIAGDPIRASELRTDDAVFLLFNSIHRVLRVEKILTVALIPFRLVATPRPLFSDCGLSIIVSADQFKPACLLFEENTVKLEHAYAQRERIFSKLEPLA